MYDDSGSDFFKPIIGFHFGFDPGQVGVSNDVTLVVYKKRSDGWRAKVS